MVDSQYKTLSSHFKTVEGIMHSFSALLFRWKLDAAVVVTISDNLYWKKLTRRSAFPTEISVNFAPENSIPLREWDSGPMFANGNYVIV